LNALKCENNELKKVVNSRINNNIIEWVIDIFYVLIH
jgi:hypothetical protein